MRMPGLVQTSQEIQCRYRDEAIKALQNLAYLVCYRSRSLSTRTILSMTEKLRVLFVALLAFAYVEVVAGSDFPVPFSGIYQSLGSEARELTSRENNTWVIIPQNVYLTLVQDQDILELRIKIEVLDNAGKTLYPIENNMWLRHVGNNQIEVYKLDKINGVFNKVGEGECTTISCTYEYVILAQNNGNPYQQRYMSTITWTLGTAGTSFTQSGSLSAKVSGVEDGQNPWLVFKTWSNQFEARPAQ